MQGPDYYLTVQPGTGNAKVILSRWPVLTVTGIQVSPNTFPRQWTSLPAGMWDPVRPVIGMYGSAAPSASGEGGQAVIFGAGYVNWCNGRNGFAARVSYVNGWPHTSLTQAAAAGASTLAVDDCTGWAITSESGFTGAAGTVYESGAQETVQVTAASAASGPGTLTLASPLAYQHAAGVMVTTLPQSVIDAVILFSAAQALQRGATSTTVHAIPGGPGGGGSIGTIREYIAAGQALLHPFRRTI